ncbi:hypothetical protein [Dokdonella sp.]|uniref:hypothetical protein n=1 Tax=Dokdonella sp. TaxID=2291710 RepID=UPI001B109B2E|nr:hypothetical protein [Dokdonella sp.]MBO9662863.1 hypothetical protein [Dokdonella sp.]
MHTALVIGASSGIGRHPQRRAGIGAQARALPPLEHAAAVGLSPASPCASGAGIDVLVDGAGDREGHHAHH